MAGLAQGDVVAEDVPLRSTRNDTPKISLQQAVRDGREQSLRDWLALLLANKNKSNIINAKDSFGFTAMHYASRFNRFKMMQLLITNDADPQVRNDDGCTPLHYAARYTPLSVNSTSDHDEAAPVTLRSDNRQIMQLLVNLCQVEVNVQDIYGVSPLQLACSRGNRVAVEILLSSSEINVDIQDKKHDTPLHAACLNGDPFIVQKLLEKNANCLLPNLEEELPIHIACQEGHLEIVSLILRLRFNERAQMMITHDHDFNYPIHLACESGNEEIVKVLFLNQADPTVRKIHDVTPLHIAAKEGFIAIVDVLLQYENADINETDEDLATPLHYAARFNKVSMIEFLLEKNADIDSHDIDSYTPLLTAAAYGQVEAMNKLLEKGAVADELDREGKSIVFIAAEENQTEVLKSLIVGSNEELGNELISTTDGTQNTPLHIACKKGNLGAVKILLKSSKVKVDARNEEDSTPLHLAAKMGHNHVIKELHRYSVAHKLDIIKDVDDDGNTSLHLACLNGHYDAAKTLLSVNANPDERNVRQWTALDCAASIGKEKIVELLIDAEADVDPKDIASITPLQLACEEGHLKVVKTLLDHGADVSICNSNGLNALDIAIENGQKPVAMEIVKSNQWEKALRNVTETPDGGYTTPMRRLISKMPDVTKIVFNRCSTTNEDTVSADSPDYTITFNYEFLEDFREPAARQRRKFTRHPVRMDESVGTDDTDTVVSDTPNVNQKGFQTTWGPKGYSRKDHCLHLLAKSRSVDLLKHPLPASLLNHKWVSYGQMLYFMNLLIYIIFVIFLTSFALSSLQPTTVTCNSVFNRTSNSSLSFSDCVAINNDTTFASLVFVPIGAAFVIVFALLKLLFELIQLIKYRLRYFLDWVNYLEIILFLFSILFASVFLTDCFCPFTWQWELGAIAVFLSWIDLVIIIRKLPVTGIYVVMFMNIFYIFLKLAFLAILLILAFGFSFFMIFHNPLNLLTNVRTPFQDAGRSLVKTATMTTGEFEFDTIFRQDGDRANVTDLQYPTSSYILWILFLILMPILLTNLLVGLAVDDIKGMQESAGINRLALRVELTLTVEEYLPNWLRRKLIIGKQVISPNRKFSYFDYIRYNIIGAFRFDSIENIRSALNPPRTPLDEVQEQNNQLSQQVDELRQSLIAISQQNERLLSAVSTLVESQGLPLDTVDAPSRSPGPLLPRISLDQLNLESPKHSFRSASVPPTDK